MSLQAGMFRVFWGFHTSQFQIFQQLYKDILYVSNYTRICLKWISAAMQAPDAFCITWPSQMTPLCINRIISLISCKLTNENARNKFSKLRIIRLFCLVIVKCTSIFPLECHSFGLEKKSPRQSSTVLYIILFLTSQQLPWWASQSFSLFIAVDCVNLCELPTFQQRPNRKVLTVEDLKKWFPSISELSNSYKVKVLIFFC